MPSAPWDFVPEEDALFVLVTGANSGIGLGIGQRLIDEFLTQRPLSAHLVLIVTTRSTKKSQETIASLRGHLRAFAETSTALRSRVGPSYNARNTLGRVHILSVQLDLCDFRSVWGAADQLVNGTLSNPSRNGQFVSLTDVRIPRLDSVIFNAGTGGWTGLEWGKLWVHLFTRGIVDAATWPSFKGAEAGHVVNPLKGSPFSKAGKPQPAGQVMGEVFCANVFGHYLFAHQLLPLLSRKSSSGLPRGRVIWESSVEPCWGDLSLDDFQAVRTHAAYESTKRLTDILSLTADLPAVRPFSDKYFRVETSSDATGASQQNPVVRPRFYVVHPGVVATTLFPLSALLFYLYKFALYLTRWLGSPWHPVSSYNGAYAPMWVAVQDQSTLDAAGAESTKLGSSTSRMCHTTVKETEVEGWGWNGHVEDEKAMLAAEEEGGVTGILRRAVGRRSGAVDLTRERREEFEALGAQCWREMERLREEWTLRYLASEQGEAAATSTEHEVRRGEVDAKLQRLAGAVGIGKPHSKGNIYLN